MAGATLGRWEFTARADLTRSRMQLHAQVDEAPEPPGTRQDDVDRLLLAYEELASNGFRHGGQPVQAAVSVAAMGWLVDVTDGAADQPPRLAIDRDPASGGMGLYLVARLAAAHGWFVEAGRKHVWAWVAPSPNS